MPGGDYHEWVQECEFCKPRAGATDDDVVEQFHFYSYSRDDAPKRFKVQRTRKERRENIEAKERFLEIVLGHRP